MSLQYTPYTVPLTLAVLVCIVGAGIAWYYREGRTELYAIWIHVALGMWGLMMLLTYSTTTLSMKTWSFLLFVPSVPFVVVSTLLFTLHFMGRDAWLTPRRRWSLLGFPVVAGVFALTNPWHELVLKDPELLTNTPFIMLDYEFGIGFYAILAGCFVIWGSYVVLIFQQFLRSRNVYQKLSFVLFFAYLTVGIALLISLFGFSPFPHFTLGPLSYALIGAFVLFSTVSTEFIRTIPIDRFVDALSNRFGSNTPLARDIVVEEVDNGILVLEEDDTIVDINTKAKRMIGAERPVGRNLLSVIETDSIIGNGEIANLLQSDTPVREVDDQLWVETPTGERCYDISITAMEEDGETVAHVVLLHDITAEKNREAKLRTREAELQLLTDTMSRFMRHNLRNELNVAAGKVDMLEAKIEDDEPQETINEIYETLSKILERSEKARYVERMVQGDHDVEELEVTELVADIGKQTQAFYDAVEIGLRVPDEAWIHSSGHISTAIENLIENSIEHNDSATKQIEITVTCEDETVSIAIGDNGPGIPEHEIEVLNEMRETDLQHGSGFGLWLVNWIVQQSNGTLEFDLSGDGTTVIIRLPRATSREI